MPRLTLREFIKRHELLRVLWLEGGTQIIFAELSPHRQWELHDFYRPADALNHEELRRHFLDSQAARPRLSVVAGKHYAVIRRAFLTADRLDSGDSAKRGRGRNVEVRFVVRPHVDVARLDAAVRLMDGSTDQDSFE